VLAVPQTTNQIDCALLAYDGSPKADEALFVSTYLAAQWQIPLHVLTAVESGQTADRELSQARMYLEAHDVDATFEQVEGPAGEAILIVTQEMGQGLTVMGGYSAHPVLEIAFGSTVDRVLRQCRQPVLICR
jgi:nucleotide-binding universal stress UspA family protein